MRVCGTPDHLGLDAICAWPDPVVPWALVQTPRGVTEDEFRAAFTWAFEQWASVSTLDCPEARQAVNARILAYAHSFDGSGGILADSEMPCGHVSHCRQRYDNGEKWDTKWPPSGNGVNLHLVALHEIGHAFGIPHAPAGIVDVMSPTLQSQLRGLTPWSIQEIQRRYGRRTTPSPTPTPTPIPGSGMTREELRAYIDAAIGLLKLIVAIVPKLAPVITLLEWVKDKDVLLDLILRFFN